MTALRVCSLYPELMNIYADRGNKAKAREQFNLILAAPLREYNDPMYKRKAADRLKKLGADKSATANRP